MGGRRSASGRVITGPSGVRVAEPFRTAKMRPRAIRRGYEIHGYTGSNGGGKSLAAVYDSLPSLAAGRPIVSTVRILDPATGLPHPLWIKLDDFRTLLEVESCDVVMDEVTGVASSRDSMGLPSAVGNILMQLRRRDVSLRWTTPNWKRADTMIREVTRGLTTCIGLIPEPAPRTTDGEDRIWRSRRLFIWRTYDAKDFDEWSTSKERSSSKAYRIRPAARQVFWRPGSVAGSAYDTFDQVASLGVVSDAGLCMDCGGKRQPKRCKCDPDAPQVEHVHDVTPGLASWRDFAAGRRLLAGLPARATVEHPEHDRFADTVLLDPVLIPETDDTPAVVVEVPTS